ncbi:fructose-specific PTS transporter subunit EIIC [uncultured Ruthenibacterium sp.]|uniref:PTS fructose transporter subunit IIABC n=1 Tax=uncultured Ruthenibacterium sp. TaxID=1905347 RepID=UPI00349EE815
MKIVDLLDSRCIALGVQMKDKPAVIDLLVDLQQKSGALNDVEKYKEAVWEREKQSSTAIEAGIAVPHAKSDAVVRPSLAAAVLDEGVDYGSMDGLPSDLFFMIAAPLDGEKHLEILARLMTLLMDPSFACELRKAGDAQTFLKVVERFEREKFDEVSKDDEKPSNSAVKYKVLAVTACPTGIAHTYMAAKALEKAGEELQIPIKVETNGSGGVKNRLTDEEIRLADGIIVAADKHVETARFSGKPVLFVPVSEGIHHPDELISQIQNKEVPVYHHIERNAEVSVVETSTAGESPARVLYKHLMNGVSHMLPFVIGGGILIALAYLTDVYDPQNPAAFGTNLPLAAFLKTVGSQAFQFMMPVLAGYIAMSIADRPGLAVGFVGGALAATGISFSTILSGSTPVSAGFLGALLAGFAGGDFMKWLQILCNRMPESLEGIKPILLYPVVGILAIGAFMCLINPVLGAINHGLVTFLNSLSGVSKVFLGAVLGGMMSIDMGGPFNKAAYVTGTGAIATAAASGAASGAIEYQMMAAVMAGGMVPPLAIALCTTFFSGKFTAEERRSGVVNYIMGLCFITEGAIPFAAADPLRVIPACVVGSAAAGALSMWFGCSLMAPHGGIFVLPVMEHRLAYLLALAAGAVIGMVLLALLKRDRRKS